MGTGADMNVSNDQARLKRAYEYIEKNPGCSHGDLARSVGVSTRGGTESFLSVMEKNGYLVSENLGRIYPFENQNQRRDYERCCIGK
jgi:hypothetical protein